MNENSCSEILDKALSERHIEEAASAEAFFKTRKIAALRRSRILKSISVFAACIILVLSLSVAAMFTNPDKKEDQFKEDAPDYENDNIYGDSAADDDNNDSSEGIYGDEGDSNDKTEEVGGLTGVYALNVGSFEESTDTDILSEVLSLESQGSSVTLTSKQKETLEKQLKVYLKEFCAANSLSEDYTFEISPLGKEYGAHIFARATVTLSGGNEVELLIVSTK